MKKILLSLLITSGISTVKAQSLYRFKPADSVLSNLDSPMKIKPFTGLNPLKQGLNLSQISGALNTNLLSFNSTPFYSSMPVAVLEGYSKMPVVKLEGHDNMPVLHLGGINKDNMEIKSLPGLPTFLSPVKQN